MKPLSSWICDSCGDAIGDVGLGLVIWRVNDDFTLSEFRIVHKGRACDSDRDDHSWELGDALGYEGQALLLSWLSLGPLKEARRSLRVTNLDGYVDLFRRLQTPWYEEARQFFNDPEVQEEWNGANEIAPYRPASLERIAREGWARHGIQS